MELITLYPFSRGELLGAREGFIDALFTGQLPAMQSLEPVDLQSAVLSGGFPEAIRRPPGKRREAWFNSYITTLLQRDVRDLANIEGLTEIPRLLSLLAARTGGLLNLSELSRSSGIPNTTLKRYLSLLQATFLYQPLPAWSANIGKRLIKSRKIHLVDTGLTAHLAGISSRSLQRNPVFHGHLLESFVVNELRKQCGWALTRARLYHFRTAGGKEVGILLEDPGGDLVGIEVKAAATVTRKDFSGLETLRRETAGRFLWGVVLYTGDEPAFFGKGLLALPVRALWSITQEERPLPGESGA